MNPLDLPQAAVVARLPGGGHVGLCGMIVVWLAAPHFQSQGATILIRWGPDRSLSSYHMGRRAA